MFLSIKSPPQRCYYRCPPDSGIGRNSTVLARNAMDALSDLLRAVNVSGALFLDSRFTAPWCVLSRPAREQGGIFAGAGHIIFFHVLTHGRCRVRLSSGGDTMSVEAGDLMLLAHDDGHLLGSDLPLAPVPPDTLVRPAP